MRKRTVYASVFASLVLAGCSIGTSNVTPNSATLTFSLPQDTSTLSSTVQTMLLLSGIVFLPAILMLMTGFVRIVVVLASLRTALGVPMLPPNQVIIGLALFLSFFVMAPTFQEINSAAIQPYFDGALQPSEALSTGVEPLREFMFKQVGDSDLALFVYLAGLPRPHSRADIPTYALVPAFVISELKISFQIVFIIYVPFLIIDLVVSSALMSMGMMMLPPTIISLPFKLLLFVMVDGWGLIARNLVISFAH